MEGSHFKQVGTGRYARLEKVGNPVPTKLEKQTETQPVKEKGMGRRSFLKGVATTAEGIAMYHFLNDIDAVDLSDTEPTHPESREINSESKHFEAEIQGYKAMALLAKDEIVFVDEHKMPVGSPVKFEDFVDKKYDEDGKLVMEQYKFSPWKIKNDIGIPDEKFGLVTEWIEYVQKIVQAQNPDRKISGNLHVYQDIQNAYNQTDEPELIALIKEGKITRYIDVVNYFSEKPVVGAPHMSRIEYVQEKIAFKPYVPTVVQEECRRLIPGLCSEESRFNADLVSEKGARSVFQIKPGTWADYNTNTSEMNSLMRQTEVAGDLLSDICKWIMGGVLISEKKMTTILNKFDTEEDFYRDFLVPVMINTYNTGIGTATDWINAYIDSVPESKMPRGKDLFLEMAEFGAKDSSVENYGEEARKYVTKIYAQAEVLAEQRQYS